MIDVVKVLIPSMLAFALGMVGTPFLTHFLYAHSMWKKSSVKKTVDGKDATISARLHNDEEKKTPRMGGIVIWGSVAVTTFLLFLLSYFFPETIFAKLSFLSRNQTWIPLAVLLAGAFCGLIDDYLVCRESGTYSGGGLALSTRLLFVGSVGLLAATWFYFKLDMSSIYIPYVGVFELGYLFIPVFLLFIIGIYSGGIIDGVDGLSGGVFAAIYASYAIISFSNGQVDLAAYCTAIVGGTLAFLWFNVPPARFYNSETGTMALTTSIVVVAFLADAVFVLPLIALLLIATSASSIIQIVSKRLRNGKKVFIVAPLHNHFQAKGWPSYKVTMRYWILAMIFAVIGVIVALTGKIGP